MLNALIFYDSGMLLHVTFGGSSEAVKGSVCSQCRLLDCFDKLELKHRFGVSSRGKVCCFLEGSNSLL